MKIYILKFESKDNPNEPWEANIKAFADYLKAEAYRKHLEEKSRELSVKIKDIRNDLDAFIHNSNHEWIHICQEEGLTTQTTGYMKRYQEHNKPIGEQNLIYQKKKYKLIDEWKKENGVEYWIDYRESDWHRDSYLIEELQLDMELKD